MHYLGHRVDIYACVTLMTLSCVAFFGYISGKQVNLWHFTCSVFFATWYFQRQGNRKAKKIFELLKLKSTIKEDFGILRQIWFILTDQGRARDRLLASQKRHSEPLVGLCILSSVTVFYQLHQLRYSRPSHSIVSHAMSQPIGYYMVEGNQCSRRSTMRLNPYIWKTGGFAKFQISLNKI